MVACIHVQETGLGFTHEIADPKAQQTSVEGQCRVEIRDHQHNMAHAQGAGAKAGDIAAGHKRRVRQQWLVKGLEPVSVGITK